MDSRGPRIPEETTVPPNGAALRFAILLLAAALPVAGEDDAIQRGLEDATGKVEQLDRVMIASGGEGGVSVATVVSKRPFAGYWEYLIDGAIFTAPPRMDHSGAALINRDGELVGIGSLFVMDAKTPGERLPGNMFVPVDLLKPILEELVGRGRQKAGRRPRIGVNAAGDDGRLKVLRVTAEGPAEAAGLRAGDLILAVGGEKVRSIDRLDFLRRKPTI
jgi:S1-C subfamily serine protease